MKTTSGTRTTNSNEVVTAMSDGYQIQTKTSTLNSHTLYLQSITALCHVLYL